MYKIKNSYGECHIMDLNMMSVSEYGARFTIGNVILLCLPIIVIAGVLLTVMMPEITFFAECMNVPNGDVCTITFK